MPITICDQFLCFRIMTVHMVGQLELKLVRVQLLIVD